MTTITTADLTQATIAGTGVFDVLMRATKQHLEQEFNQNRIKGGEYSQVYLGSLTQVLGQSVQFLLQKDKAAYEATLAEAQVRLIEAQIIQAGKQNDLMDQQILKLIQEVLLAEAQVEKMQHEAALMQQQVLNLQAEALNIPKQGAKLDADVALSGAQKLLVNQQTINAVTEELEAQKRICKLNAEFDVLMETKLKTATETGLLLQKTATEQAQTTALGVDADSIVGRQKALYQAQATGFTRDAEQKAAGVLVDAWKVRRSTDEATPADGTNKLDDATVGSAVTKLLAGIGA